MITDSYKMVIRWLRVANRVVAFGGLWTQNTGLSWRECFMDNKKIIGRELECKCFPEMFPFCLLSYAIFWNIFGKSLRHILNTF